MVGAGVIFVIYALFTFWSRIYGLLGKIEIDYFDRRMAPILCFMATGVIIAALVVGY